MKDYFVMYETENYTNSFLVTDSDSSSSAWEEAVEHIESNYPEETCVITKFELVK